MKMDIAGVMTALTNGLMAAFPGEKIDSDNDNKSGSIYLGADDPGFTIRVNLGAPPYDAEADEEPPPAEDPRLTEYKLLLGKHGAGSLEEQNYAATHISDQKFMSLVRRTRRAHRGLNRD